MMALDVVFAVPLLESSAFVFPGEIAAPLGGVLAFQHRVGFAVRLAARATRRRSERLRRAGDRLALAHRRPGRLRPGRRLAAPAGRASPAPRRRCRASGAGVPDTARAMRPDTPRLTRTRL